MDPTKIAICAKKTAGCCCEPWLIMANRTSKRVGSFFDARVVGEEGGCHVSISASQHPAKQFRADRKDKRNWWDFSAGRGLRRWKAFDGGDIIIVKAFCKRRSTGVLRRGSGILVILREVDSVRVHPFKLSRLSPLPRFSGTVQGVFSQQTRSCSPALARVEAFHPASDPGPFNH